MDFSDINKSVIEMRTEMERVQQEFRSKMQNLFTESTKAFFAEAPMIKAIVWNQYTPYFNDGEECVFGVNDVYFITGNDKFDIDNYDLRDLSWGIIDFDADDEIADEAEFFETATWRNAHKETLAKYGQEAFNAVKAMSNIISENEDIMRAVFGDHTLVALLPDRTITEEFEHD